MNVRWRLGLLPLVLAAAAVALVWVLMVGPASATHPRPKGATPIRVANVLAYNPCAPGVANRQHGAPLAGLSCNPPQQVTSRLTTGTGDAWPGTVAKGISGTLISVKVTSPEDVKIISSGTDIRCIGNSVPGFCSTANTDNASVPDYSGQLGGNATIRITDHFNGPIGACGACSDPATVQDLSFPVTGTCATTPADGTVGSTCGVTTTANAVVPSSVQDNKRSIVETQTINIFDGGSTGVAMAPDQAEYGTQGIFIP